MNTYDYDENFQSVDEPDNTNDRKAEKGPNVFKQLIYSVMPGKYGELSKVGVKGFIFYYLFWCLIMCTVAWISMVVTTGMEVVGANLMNGEVLVYDRLPIIILILIGISIPICLIMTIIFAVIFAISYFIEGVPEALIIKAISKKQCSLFDLYKSAVYCQTPVNIAILCMMILMGVSEDLAWMSLPIGIAKIVSLVILIFGIQNLPAKPFIPQNKQYATEGNQYKEETINQVSSTPSKPRVTPGYWTCSCGRQNPSYTGTCTCGKSKY